MAIVDFDPKQHKRGRWRWWMTGVPYERQWENNEISQVLSDESEAAMRMTDSQLANLCDWGNDYVNQLHVKHLEMERRKQLDS